MTDFEFLLKNPELAKNIRFEISGENLLELSATLIKASREEAMLENKEQYISVDEACVRLKRSRMTLYRWGQKGILRANQIGLYKKSDVDKFLNK